MTDDTSDLVLHGPAYSAYVRVARIVLAEKGLDYRLREVDVFANGGPPADFLALNPFGRVPALTHGDFVLYETAAITRYLDEAFPGPSLQPAEVRSRARMLQAIRIIDAYGYWPWVRVIFSQRVEGGERGVADEQAIADALPEAQRALDALEAVRGEGPWIAGKAFSLADAHLVPMIDYLQEAEEGRRLLELRPGLSAWWKSAAKRPSVRETRVLVHLEETADDNKKGSQS